MAPSTTEDVWRGTLIEESLDDEELLEHVDIVDVATGTLESEEEKGEFTFHRVEVPDKELDVIVSIALKSLKSSWYFHLVKGGTMIVMFKDKKFTVNEGDEEGLQAIKDYGMAHGIHADQLHIEGLFENPFG